MAASYRQDSMSLSDTKQKYQFEEGASANFIFLFLKQKLLQKLKKKRLYKLDITVEITTLIDTHVHSGGSRGGSMGLLDPAPRPRF